MTSGMDNLAIGDHKHNKPDDVDARLATIEKNLNSNQEHVITEGLDDFKLILHKHNEPISGKIFLWMKNNSNVEIRALVTKKLQEQITAIVNDSSIKLLTIFPVDTTDINEYVVELLMEAIESFSDDIIKKLLCGCVIPEMFNPGNRYEEAHEILIDFGFHLINKCPITKLSAQEVKLLVTQLIEQHIKVLEKWREENFKRWHELWMFLVRFSAKQLHLSMDMANKLLRVVEYAFRNSSYEQRLKGYECWKELIDNASLDMKHMCSSKQIKLLVTPLRAKFSKMEVVICKRFEVFLYLLEKLQGNSVLCLNEFLEFCFGVSNTNVSSKNGQGKLVPNLWLRSIQVFLAILGDQTHISAELNRTIFDKPIINESNIGRFDQVIVYSVIESSTILKIISINDADKLSILKSLWNALFSILKKSNAEIQEKCFQTICSSIGALFKDYNEEITYLSLLNAFVELVNSPIDYRLYSNSFKLLIENTVTFLNEEVVSEDLLDQFEASFLKVCEEKRLFEFIADHLKKLHPSKNEVVTYELWKILGIKMTSDHEDDLKSAANILSWPALHLHKFTILSEDVYFKWFQLFSQSSTLSKTAAINELDKMFKANPLLSSNISTLISSLGKDDVVLEVELLEPLLKLMASIMSLPLLSQESAEKLFLLIFKCLKTTIACDTVNLEHVDNLCQCLQKISHNRKDAALLETIEKLVRKMVPFANTAAGKRLKTLISTFSNTNLQKKSLKLLSPDPNISPGSNIKRSIRMTQMVFDKNGSTPNKEKVEALQLFGKDVETLTPLKVKGSILQNTPTSNSRSKRMVNSVKKSHTPEPPIMDDHTSDFVVINTEVKIQKDMLTDHQKEKMRQRREDIPALYQDLSQSQTQNSLSTDTQSNNIPDIEEKQEVHEAAPVCPENESSCASIIDQKLEITTEEKHTIKVIEQLKKQEEVDSNDSNDDSGYKRGNKALIPRKERELMRIQMDIVGGNSFIQNLPSKRPRKVNEKVSVLTPKKSKKAQINESNQSATASSVDGNKNSTTEDQSEQIETNKMDDSTPLSKSLALPVVLLETVLSFNQTSDTPSSSNSKEDTPNRRKNKLMKPIKNFDTPTSEKKKSKSDNKETPVTKTKKKEPKEVKNIKNSPTKSQAAEAPQSEILFESEVTEVNNEVDNKTPNSRKRKSDKPKKGFKGVSNDQNINSSSQEQVQMKRDETPESTVNKPKKTPKELMKKNKEKVKTIQTQLKLATLSDLEGSSEKSKPKNAKLIFIRELTNSNNSKDTKVSPAGLKRNKDNKSKSIAYTIETPASPVKISSLDMEQPSCSKSSNLETDIKTVKPKASRKRKRIDRVCESSSSYESSPETKKRSKLPKLNPILTEDEVAEIIGVTPSPPSAEKKISAAKKESTNMESDTSKEILQVCPESPSRSTRSKTSSPCKKSVNSSHSQDSPSVRSLFKEYESEDIIESSQGSIIENSSTSIGNISKSKIKQSPKLQNSSVKFQEPEKQEITPEIPMVTELSPETSSVEKSPDAKTDKPLSQADTLTCESNIEVQPPVVQIEVPVRQELSDSEKLLSMADTVSIESCVTEEMAKNDNQKNITSKDVIEKCDKQTSEISDVVMAEDNDTKAPSPVSNEVIIETFSTPQKNKENLPGSPVSQATPTYKKELLDNTSDISPICSQTTDIDMGRDILDALDAAIEETSSNKEVERVVPSAKPAEENKIMLSSNERSNKLLNMVNVESPVSSLKKTSKRKSANPVQMKTRYEKLFSMYANKENGDEAKENGSLPCTESVEDILTFTREVPSPLAVPSSSILKRKLADTDDSYSPCPKRKRVNFSYPCITSTKLFIRHKDELNTHYKPSFGANLFDDDPQEGDSEEEDPFADPDMYRQCSSEESMDITNSLSLCSNKPIDQRLVACSDNLEPLWKRLTNPMYSNKLKRLLKSKKIETVGDLASLNEIEINRLPFKEPKVKTVRKALFYYFNSIFNKSQEKEEDNFNAESFSASLVEEKSNIEDTRIPIEVEIEECSKDTDKNIEIQPALSLKEEFRLILTRMKDKNTTLEEFGGVLIDLVDESELVNLLESVYNTDFRKYFRKPHWRYLIENIVKSGGTTDLFDIISDLAESNKVFGDQLEHIVQLRIEQDPLKNILKKKTLVQVSLALQDCIKEEEFKRENVLQTCFMPLIKSPSDIKNYFNSLTIVQIHDLFIERVQPSDLTCFLDQIKEHYGNYTIAQCANKQDVLKICSKEDLAAALIEKETEVGAVKQIVSHISDSDKLLELYNYIGTLLPLRLRIESHIELLRNIPLDK